MGLNEILTYILILTFLSVLNKKNFKLTFEKAFANLLNPSFFGNFTMSRKG